MSFKVSGVSETTQDTAVRPWTPSDENVFKSACIPAPAEQSEPAMVMALGGVMVVEDRRICQRKQGNPVRSFDPVALRTQNRVNCDRKVKKNTGSFCDR